MHLKTSIILDCDKIYDFFIEEQAPELIQSVIINNIKKKKIIKNKDDLNTTYHKM
jgi:hypothetical protein